MSSHKGGRSPKDLRHLLSVARQDAAYFPEDVEENLAKLKSLPKDEVSENAMLRDRIDQQSELICVLKKQADTSLIKCQTLQENIKELQAAKEEAERTCHDQLRQHSVLEKRFAILYQNHEEIIKIKDGYKVVNDELRRENKELLSRRAEEIAAVVKEKNCRIEGLEKDLKIVMDKLESSDGLMKAMKEQSIEKEKLLNEEVANQKSKAESFEQIALESEKKAKLASCQMLAMEDEMNKLCEENTKQIQESLQQKETISEKEQKITELAEKVRELELLMKRQNEKLAKEIQDASANSQVQKLKSLLKKADDKVLNHDKEFQAYKAHSEKLLSKERELNSKLRQLIG